MALEPSADRSLDKKRSKMFEEVNIAYDELLADYFLEDLEKANIFKINFFSHKNYKDLKKIGYDAYIELNIEELSLKKIPSLEQSQVCVGVAAKMVDLHREKIIWKRNEMILSKERYTLDEWKQKMDTIRLVIDQILQEIAFRLANDIIYS